MGENHVEIAGNQVQGAQKYKAPRKVYTSPLFLF
jgi:hypothetical protein